MRLVLRGEIDSAAAPNLERALAALLEEGQYRLVLDFEEVVFVASAGLRVLLMAAKKIQRTAGRLALAGLSPGVRNVFETAGFTAIFDIHTDHAAAIQAVRLP